MSDLTFIWAIRKLSVGDAFGCEGNELIKLEDVFGNNIDDWIGGEIEVENDEDKEGEEVGEDRGEDTGEALLGERVAGQSDVPLLETILADREHAVGKRDRGKSERVGEIAWINDSDDINLWGRELTDVLK